MEKSMRNANKILAAFAVLVAVPVLYVLSLGPAIWLADRQLLSHASLLAYSYPAVLSFPDGTMRQEVVRRYLLLWSPHP